MLSIRGPGTRLCDGLSRREIIQIGSLGLTGPALPQLMAEQRPASEGKAKSCILLFLMGGPPQHSTWDPKPDAPAGVRGEIRPIATAVPGLLVGELMPRLARLADRLCVLRAVSTDDNAHSSSGYYMMTGQPHQPMNVENANPGAPNNWPFIGALVQRLRGNAGPLPAAVRLPHRIFHTDGSVWPGQDAGFLGRAADPWLLRCEPASPRYQIPEFSLSADVPLARLEDRQALLGTIDQRLAAVERSGALRHYDRQTRQAFGLLPSA